MPQKPSRRTRRRTNRRYTKELKAEAVQMLLDGHSATAILDRFLHHAELITISGRSYRLKNAPSPAKRAKAAPRGPVTIRRSR